MSHAYFFVLTLPSLTFAFAVKYFFDKILDGKMLLCVMFCGWMALYNDIRFVCHLWNEGLSESEYRAGG